MDGKKVVTNILLFAAGTGLGFATGYFIQKRKYEALLISEIEQVKEAYSPARKPFSSPEEAVEALIPKDEESEMDEILVGNGYVQITDGDKVSVENFDGDVIAEGVVRADENGKLEIDTDTGEAEPEVEAPAQPIKYNNVFNEKGPARKEDDLSNPEPLAKKLPVRMGPPVSVVEEKLPVEQERMLQSPDKPYIITVSQFMDDGIHEGDKITLTWFEEDETLIDEKETIVPNLEELVGEVNLHHFGLGSDDKNAVYIRNERIQADFEVIRDARSFQEVVLNIPPAKEKSRPLKMRDDDQ